MTPEELFTDIDAFCQANADEANVQKYSRYFKTGFDAYGVSFEKTKDKIKILFEDPAITLDLIRQTGPLLVKSGKYEETVFAVLLLKPFSKQFTKEKSVL